MEPNNRVPEGVSIAVNHLLNVPHNSETSNVLHHEADVHMIIKATKHDGSYKIEIVDQFTTIESEYFQTDRLENEFLCFLTTGIFGFGVKAVCRHSAQKRVSITRNRAKSKGRCPHARNGLSVYSHCRGRVEKLKEDIETRKEVMTEAFNDYPIDAVSTYTLQILLGEESENEEIFQKEITLKKLCEVCI